MKTATSGFIQVGQVTSHCVDIVAAPPEDTACNWRIVCRHDPRTKGRFRSSATAAAEASKDPECVRVLGDMALICGNVTHRVCEP